MTLPPPLLSAKDTEHLRLLVIFHYIAAALAVLGIGFLCLHFFIMNTVFGHPELWKTANRPPSLPPQVLTILKWAYAVFGTFLATGGLLNLLSASFLRRRCHRVFSLVVAGLNCVHIPFGTALGVFTIVVLSRESVRDAYEG